MSVFARHRIHIICDSFALYGCDPLIGKQAKSWFDYCVSLSELASHPFDEGSCDPGNTKMVLFKNCKRAFEKNLNSVKSICLRSSADVNEIGTYGIMNANFSNDRKYNYFGCCDSFFGCDQLTKIGIKLCKLTKPKYGIFYKFPFVYLPEHYPSGMAGGGELDVVPGRLFNPKHVDIEKRIGKWQFLKLDYKEKLFDLSNLREIYPINFINENHLNHNVFPKTALKDWIYAADHRGTLEKVTDELYSWTVPDEDLYQVTVDLAQTDILLCVNKDNPQRYDYGVRPEDQIAVT